jgi:hypothetical protein
LLSLAILNLIYQNVKRFNDLDLIINILAIKWQDRMQDFPPAIKKL